MLTLLKFLQLPLQVVRKRVDGSHAEAVLLNVLVFDLKKKEKEKPAGFLLLWTQLYLSEEILFPGVEPREQPSLAVVDLLQAVVMAGGQFLHHSFSV